MVDVRATHFTAAELEELALPGLPTTKRGIAMRAADEDWARSTAPRRGNEAHAFAVTSLPEEARTELIARASATPHPEVDAEQAAPSHVRPGDWQRAIARTEVMFAVSDAIAGGMQVGAAIALVATTHAEHVKRGIVARKRTAPEGAPATARAIKDWYYAIRELPRTSWCARLAPSWKPTRAAGPMSEDAWNYFVSYRARPGNIRHAVAYRATVERAKIEGWTPVPSLATFVRRWDRLPRAPKILLTEGPKALKETLPTQRRDRSGMRVLEVVCGDGHRWDVMVRWPSGLLGRPIMLAYQDIYSGKILAYRVDRTEHSGIVRLALADLVREFGVPESLLLDNGRAFASKAFTGGIPNRFRFTVREDEMQGVAAQLGIGVRWARPYSGRSKPIERAWRDFCDTIAKHPAFHGAYLGNSPKARPENAKGAVDLDVFMSVVAAGVVEHNARAGRKSHIAQGRSFDEVFAESYAAHPVTRATEEQLRVALLEAKDLKVSPAGELALHRNTYRSELLFELAGQMVTARFDPLDLHRGLFVYAKDGRSLGFAECVQRTGFLDTDAARNQARVDHARLKSAKKLADEIRVHPPHELAAMHNPAFVAGKRPETKVVAPLFNGPKPPKRVTPTEDAEVIDAAFTPTEGERSLRERRDASDQLVAAAGQRALAAAPRRRTPL